MTAVKKSVSDISAMADQRDKLPERLRVTTAQMALHSSAPMHLWQEHSTCALQAANEIERLGQEIEGEQEKRDREIRNKALEEAAVAVDRLAYDAGDAGWRTEFSLSFASDLIRGLKEG